jgi:hypothetical protein
MRIFILSFSAAEDNEAMNKERDLLPWILGGLSAAAIAVAFAAVSTHRDAPTLAPQVVAARPAASPPAPPEPPTATTAQAMPPAKPPDAAPMPPAAQTVVAPEVQAGQIWECMTKGVKTFSNNPCGEKSTLLDVGPVNTMSAAAMHYARAYPPPPRYSAGYPDQSAPGDADDYSDQTPADTGGDSYTIVQGVGFVPRRRAENIHRPHYPAAPPSPPAHHSPGSVRRY